MGLLSDLSQRKYKGEEVRPRFELRVAGRKVERVRRISGSYAKESGSSTMTVEADFPFGSFEEEMVSLRLGYGDRMVEYFTGKLFSPDRHPTTGVATCEIKGPFSAMQESFDEEMDYTGDSAAEFFVDLGRRADQSGRLLVVRDGFDITLEEAAFVRETELLEAARTVTEKIDFVMLDRPGYQRLVMPTPAPGAGAKSQARYDESSYPPDAFKAVPQTQIRYSKVVAFRRQENEGSVSYPVLEEFPVAHRGRVKPPKRRIFWIPEFPGTPRQARNTCQRKSQLLSKGLFAWSLNDVYINPELLLFDSITASRTNLVDYRLPSLEMFSCLVDKQIDFEIAPGRFHMSLSGDVAVRTSVIPLAEIPERMAPLVSRGIEKASEGATPLVTA